MNDKEHGDIVASIAENSDRQREFLDRYEVVPSSFARDVIKKEHVKVWVTLEDRIAPLLCAAKAAHAKGEADVVEHMINGALRRVTKLSRELQEAIKANEK